MEKIRRWETIFYIEDHGQKIKIVNYVSNMHCVVLTKKEWSFIVENNFVVLFGQHKKTKKCLYERMVGARKIERQIKRWEKSSV